MQLVFTSLHDRCAAACVDEARWAEPGLAEERLMFFRASLARAEQRKHVQVEHLNPVKLGRHEPLKDGGKRSTRNNDDHQA